MVLAARALAKDAAGISLDVAGEKQQGTLNRTYRAADLKAPVKVTNTGEPTLQAVLTVAGVNAGAYKFGSLNPATGNIEGFEIDLVNEIAKAIFGNATGHVRYVALTVPQRFTAVEDGKVDIVVDTITITCYRRTLVDFSTVYYNATQRLLVPSGSGVKDIRELAHQRVCALDPITRR